MFVKKYTRLYAEDAGESPRVYLVLPDKENLPERIAVDDAILNKDRLDATFVYTANPLSICDEKASEDFVSKIKALIERGYSTRAFIWLTEKAPIVLGVGAFCDITTCFCAVNLVYNLDFNVFNGISLQYAEQPTGEKSILFNRVSSDKSPFAFNTISSAGNSIYSCRLDVDGDFRGCFRFKFNITLQEFLVQFNPGMRTAYLDLTDRVAMNLFPFLRGDVKNPTLMFDVSIYPCDIFNDISTGQISNRNSKTYFSFRPGGQPEPLSSFYQTVYGDYIVLLPETEAGNGKQVAGFSFVRDFADFDQRLCPEGDFILMNEGNPNLLLCGLNGTETIAFHKHDRMRFLSNSPAFVKRICSKPPQVGEQDDPEAQKIFSDYTTSWCAVIGDKTGALYTAQPNGFHLYGSREGSELLEHERTGIPLPIEPVYAPILPYNSCTGNATWIEEIEKSVISFERKRLFISSYSQKPSLQNTGSKEPRTITTPNGYLVQLAQNTWETISLGQCVQKNGYPETIYFEKPNNELVNAFQSPSLFLVAANGINLGTYTNEPKRLNKPAFHNVIHVQDFMFKSNVGEGSEYGKYASLMIVKGTKGKLYDPENKETGSLVSNMDIWSRRSAFSSPITGRGGIPDLSQQPMLSQWLLSYFEKAYQESDREYFENFNKIATDPNWQGILFLNLPLTADNLPEQMSSVLSGISPGEKPYIHHWGIVANTVKLENGDVSYDNSSSIFGLIYYKDPAVAQAGDVKAVSPGNGDYSFKLLTLKVLFENTCIKNMECYAQLTLNRLLGMQTSGMGSGGNVYNTALMRGIYQNCDGVSSFRLRNINKDKFLFKDCAIQCVGLSGVEMSVRDAKENLYWFGLEGVLDFQKTEPDIFSFGSDSAAYLGEQGLYFSNTGLEMRQKDGVQIFREIMTDCKLDAVKSHVRDGGLYQSLRLEIKELLAGTKGIATDQPNYIPLLSSFFKKNLDDEWYGLLCRINLGTLGALAGNTGLDSYILICWSPSGGGCIALSLPGAESFLDIQNILKLSIGSMRLGYYPSERVFYIALNDIALKAFGIAKLPPSGTIAMYLYGSMNGTKNTPIGWYTQYLKK